MHEYVYLQSMAALPYAYYVGARMKQPYIRFGHDCLLCLNVNALVEYTLSTCSSIGAWVICFVLRY